VALANYKDRKLAQFSSVVIDAVKLILQIAWTALFANFLQDISQLIRLLTTIWLVILCIREGTVTLGSLYILIILWPKLYSFIGFLTQLYELLI